MRYGLSLLLLVSLLSSHLAYSGGGGQIALQAPESAVFHSTNHSTKIIYNFSRVLTRAAISLLLLTSPVLLEGAAPVQVEPLALPNIPVPSYLSQSQGHAQSHALNSVEYGGFHHPFCLADDQQATLLLPEMKSALNPAALNPDGSEESSPDDLSQKSYFTAKNYQSLSLVSGLAGAFSLLVYADKYFRRPRFVILRTEYGSRYVFEVSKGEEFECLICLSGSTNDLIIESKRCLPNHHRFHLDCLTNWVTSPNRAKCMYCSKHYHKLLH